MGFAKQGYWSGLPFPSPWDLPDPGIEPAPLLSPILADGFFTISTTWEAQERCHLHLIPSALEISLVIWETKAGPLSHWIDLGSPNWGIISLIRALEISEVILVWVRNLAKGVSQNQQISENFLVPRKVKVKFLSRVRLCDPVDYSPLGSSVYGILQARVLECSCHCLLHRALL